MVRPSVPRVVVLYCPSDLPAERADAFEEHVQNLRRRVLDHVETVLLDVGSPGLAQEAYDVAFPETDALPKRESRPKLETALLAEQTYLSFDPSGERLEPLLQFTVVVQEYYDVLDDLLDDDVTAGHESRVLLVSQTLMPMLVRLLGELGDAAIEYWTDRAFELLAAPRIEATREPSPEDYAELLDHQAVLFGFVTGLAAVVTRRDDETIERAERLGRTAYKHAQYVLDVEQRRSGRVEGWNAAELHSEADVVDQLERWRAEVDDLVTAYPDERADLIRALVALDVDEWLRTTGSAER